MAAASGSNVVGQLKSGASILLQGNLGIPVMLLVLLGMMTLPLPPFLLDTFFTFNIALSIVVLLVSVYSKRPLDFAIFPTILLIATLLRLALNVASTRVVLLYGHEGGDAAGKVIEAFGEVLIGGNYAVGLVVFMILMIINFVVVTKGAGRVSEVSARFTLDAMPGKQMAIDEHEDQERRIPHDQRSNPACQCDLQLVVAVSGKYPQRLRRPLFGLLAPTPQLLHQQADPTCICNLILIFCTGSQIRQRPRRILLCRLATAPT